MQRQIIAVFHMELHKTGYIEKENTNYLRMFTPIPLFSQHPQASGADLSDALWGSGSFDGIRAVQSAA